MALKTNLILRRADRDDLDAIVSWMDDPAFQRFLYGEPTRTPRQLREQIVGMLGRSAGHSVPAGIHLIVEHPEHGPVGMLSIGSMSWRNRSCNIDTYLVGSARHGINGLIAFYRVLEYCFQELNMRRINIYIYAFNPRSWRMFEFSGAKKELVLEKHVARDGEFIDMYGYGLLRPHWEKIRDRFSRKFKGIDLATMIATAKQSPSTAERES